MNPNPTLTLDLVPSTAWWSNVRSNVSKADWEKCKKYSKTKTDGVCIICGSSSRQQGKRYNTEAHEIWAYSRQGVRFVQTLVDIWPLCSWCHQCKHMGRSIRTMDVHTYARLFTHFVKVNGWDDNPDYAEQYINSEFALWQARSQWKWNLDVSFLETLGITPERNDRE